MARFPGLTDPSPLTDSTSGCPSGSETRDCRWPGTLSTRNAPWVLSLNPADTRRLEWLVSLGGLAWFTTSSLGTHPSTPPWEGQATMERNVLTRPSNIVSCSQAAALLQKNLPNLVCIINMSFPIQSLAQDSRILRNAAELNSQRDRAMTAVGEDTDSFTHLRRSVCGTHHALC